MRRKMSYDYERALRVSEWRREHPNEDFPSWANLYGAALSGVDLHSADLSGANLYSANLSWVDLHSADLHGADLSWANLSWADLYGADLGDWEIEPDGIARKKES